MGKNKNKNNGGNKSVPVAQPIKATPSTVSEEVTKSARPNDDHIVSQQLSNENMGKYTTEDGSSSPSEPEITTVSSENSCVTAGKEVHIVTASSSVNGPDVDQDEDHIVVASSSTPNVYDVSFRSNTSVTEITFENSPPASSNQGIQEEQDDYIPGIAIDDEDNVLNLSESIPIDISTSNQADLCLNEEEEAPDRHQGDTMFTRHNETALSATNAKELPENAGFVDMCGHYINNRLFVFTDAFDLTKSSDLADSVLAFTRIEYFARKLLPLPLFLIECLVFLPRINLVVTIFAMRLMYNLLCLYIHAHVFVISVPLRIIEGIVMMIFESLVAGAVLVLNQLPGGQQVPKGLNGHHHKVH